MAKRQETKAAAAQAVVSLSQQYKGALDSLGLLRNSNEMDSRIPVSVAQAIGMDQAATFANSFFGRSVQSPASMYSSYAVAANYFDLAGYLQRFIGQYLMKAGYRDIGPRTGMQAADRQLVASETPGFDGDMAEAAFVVIPSYGFLSVKDKTRVIDGGMVVGVAGSYIPWDKKWARTLADWVSTMGYMKTTTEIEAALSIAIYRPDGTLVRQFDGSTGGGRTFKTTPMQLSTIGGVTSITTEQNGAMNLALILVESAFANYMPPETKPAPATTVSKQKRASK
ncbi:hypothetical protein D4R52_01110 [bacterium]|nr:MAG: hypothetical protein D4R52_01110 [bacterium]